jgi:NAD+ kinase
VKTAALITHSHPPAATEAVATAVAVAREAGWRLVGTEEELAKHGAAAEGIEVSGDQPVPDICLVLGGDGSILHALRRFAGTGVPVFGVNFGTVGFLAAVEREDAEEGIRRALAGEIETIELPGLEVKLQGVSGIGLNDVTLTRRPHDRVAELSYWIAGGREPVEVAVDGVHIADLAPGAVLEIRFADALGRLAQLPGTSFYQRIREKFGHLAV